MQGSNSVAAVSVTKIKTSRSFRVFLFDLFFTHYEALALAFELLKSLFYTARADLTIKSFQSFEEKFVFEDLVFEDLVVPTDL